MNKKAVKVIFSNSQFPCGIGPEGQQSNRQVFLVPLVPSHKKFILIAACIYKFLFCKIAPPYYRQYTYHHYGKETARVLAQFAIELSGI